MLENLGTIAAQLKKRRIELQLKQAEVAAIIGVSEDCITYWENERSRPQINHYPKIVEFLGCIPVEIDDSVLGAKIKKYRIENGLILKKLAQLTGFDPATLKSWENNKTFPSKKVEQKIKEFIL